MEMGISRVVNQIIGKESASVPRCHVTPIDFIRIGGFSVCSLNDLKSFNIQSMSPTVPMKIRVVSRNRAVEIPMQTFLTDGCILSEMFLGSTFGRTSNINPDSSGTSVMTLNSPVNVICSPPQ